MLIELLKGEKTEKKEVGSIGIPVLTVLVGENQEPFTKLVDAAHVQKETSNPYAEGFKRCYERRNKFNPLELLPDNKNYVPETIGDEPHY